MRNAIILAGGKGSRMQSTLPKPVLPINNRPMLIHVIDALIQSQLKANDICIVHGVGKEYIIQAVKAHDYANVHFAHQASPQGTGHAAFCALNVHPGLATNGATLILYADTPLITPATLISLMNTHENKGNALTLLTTYLDNPTGYGRIQRCSYGQVRGIVEEKDASEHDKSITEVNTGIMVIDNKHLPTYLHALSNDNAQGEYYLTDVVSIADSAHHQIGAITLDDPSEVMGANTPEELASLDDTYNRRQAKTG